MRSIIGLTREVGSATPGNAPAVNVSQILRIMYAYCTLRQRGIRMQAQWTYLTVDEKHLIQRMARQIILFTSTIPCERLVHLGLVEEAHGGITLTKKGGELYGASVVGTDQTNASLLKALARLAAGSTRLIGPAAQEGDPTRAT